MAITGIEYAVLRQAQDQGFVAPAPQVLQLGEAEWYGDVPIARLLTDIDTRVADPATRATLKQAVEDLDRDRPPQYAFDLGRIFFQAVLAPAAMTTIDLHGTAEALRLNLNEPIDLGRAFDLILNLGTTEHVFNIYQAFKTIHDHVSPGGLMIHGLPFTGWIDHGFYNFQPTFYFDIAAANRYQVLGAVYAELSPLRLVPVTNREAVVRMAAEGSLGPNSLLYVIFKAPAEPGPFTAPMQGYYAGQLSGQAVDAWHDLR
jgi:hypothetical protein